jgi:hypothetical protein
MSKAINSRKLKEMNIVEAIAHVVVFQHVESKTGNHNYAFFTFRAADTMSIPEQLNAFFLRDFFWQIWDKYCVGSWKNAMSFITAILL